MILKDENGKFVNPKDFVLEIALEAIDEDINEIDLEAGLSEMYMTALSSDLESYGLPQTSLESFFPELGKKILDKVKSFICPQLNEDDTQDTIVNTVLDAIAAILPGGKIITWVLKKLMKFILKKGVVAFCPVS